MLRALPKSLPRLRRLLPSQEMHTWGAGGSQSPGPEGAKRRSKGKGAAGREERREGERNQTQTRPFWAKSRSQA